MNSVRAWYLPAGLVAGALVMAVGLVTWAGWWEVDGRKAPAPVVIPYQGVLERNGQLVQAVGAETVSFRVSLWDALEGGNKVWPAAAGVYDSHQVNVYEGRFALRIGEDQSYEHVPETALFLDVQVKMEAEPDFVPLAGRQAFLYAPHAITANRSDTDFPVLGSLSAGGNVSAAGDVSAGGGLSAAGGLSVGADAVVGSPAVGADLNVYGDVTADNLWLKVFEADFTDTPVWTASGLDGDAARVFKVIAHGSVPGSASDFHIVLRVNGDGNPANYRSFVLAGGDGTGGEWGTTGFYLGRHAFGFGSAFLIEYDVAALGTAFSSKRVGHGKSIFAYTNNTTIAWWGGGTWGGTTPIDSLSVVNAGNVNMSGRLTVFAMNH